VWKWRKITEQKIKMHGSIGYFGLTEWWISEFTENEREYIELKLPPDCIRRIVVGLRMDFARRARIVRAIEAVLDLSLYDLKYVPLAEEQYRGIDGLNLRASAALR
jgi:hypothetical protein